MCGGEIADEKWKLSTQGVLHGTVLCETILDNLSGRDLQVGAVTRRIRTSQLVHSFSKSAQTDSEGSRNHREQPVFIQIGRPTEMGRDPYENGY